MLTAVRVSLVATAVRVSLVALARVVRVVVVVLVRVGEVAALQTAPVDEVVPQQVSQGLGNVGTLAHRQGVRAPNRLNHCPATRAMTS